MEAAVIPGSQVWGVNCLNDLLAALNHPELETEKSVSAEDPGGGLAKGRNRTGYGRFPGSGGTGEC